MIGSLHFPAARNFPSRPRDIRGFFPLKAESGFEQKSWSFNGKEKPLNADIAIPVDAEDIVVTWKGGIDAAEAMGEISVLMGAAAIGTGFPGELEL